jgi:hypothetical protein
MRKVDAEITMSRHGIDAREGAIPLSGHWRHVVNKDMARKKSRCFMQVLLA